MPNRGYDGQNCSIARALEVVGERWTLMIIRDVLLGLRRFEQLRESLGIASNVLTDRLNRLVAERHAPRVPPLEDRPSPPLESGVVPLIYARNGRLRAAA